MKTYGILLKTTVASTIIFSKFYVPNGFTGAPKQGWDLNAAYQWIPRGCGVGVHYSGYFTSITGDAKKLNIGLHYARPEFVMRQQAGRRWIFRESIGLGYARRSERVESLSTGINGYGAHVEVAAE